jgi:hypothetical protein
MSAKGTNCELVYWIHVAHGGEWRSTENMAINPHHPDDGGSSTSEKSVNFHQTTWPNIPADIYLRTRRH